MMYRLHIANRNYSSWSLRPWLLLRERDIPFEERLHGFLNGSSRSAFRAFSPSGTVPCLEDGARFIWDSLAIVEYLAERHPGIWPLDSGSRAWARSAAAEMHAGFDALRGTCPMSCGVRVRLRELPDQLCADLVRLQELWQDGLDRSGGPFLAGSEFSAVDAFFAPVAFRVQTYGLELDPASRAYAQRLLELDGMQEWYAAALARTVARGNCCAARSGG